MKTLISFFLILLLSSPLCNAQIVDRTERRAKQKANNRVDRKVDQGIDKGLDAIEGLFGKKKKSKEEETDPASDEKQAETATSKNNPYSQMMGGDVDVQDSYTFDHNILLDVQSFDKKGKPEMSNKMKMFFAESTPHFGMEMKSSGSDNFMIYDMKAYEMVTLMDQGERKMGVAMKFDPSNFENVNDGDQSSAANRENVRFEKTGRTKTISGYSCDEYKVIDPEGDPDTENHVWMTQDIDANWIGMMSNMMATNKKMQKELTLPDSYPAGTVIQVVSSSTKNQEKTVMTVEEINKNQKKVISTSDYQMMSMPGGGK